MSRSGARDPNKQGQSVGLGRPATGVSAENVDSAQQPNTPTSQIIGSSLALDQLIGTTPEGCQPGVSEELPGKQQGAPIKPTQPTVSGVGNEYYRTYQGTRNDKRQHHLLPPASFMPPAGTNYYTSAARTQTVQIPVRIEPKEPPPARDSGKGGQNNNQGGGGSGGGGSNGRDGKGKDLLEGRQPPDEDPPPKKDGRLPYRDPGGGGGGGEDDGSEAGSKREREKRERIVWAEIPKQRRGHLS